MPARPHSEAVGSERDRPATATLLARAAENLYWAGRYLERAEDTARMVAVHGETHFDLPVGEDVGWWPLLDVTGSAARYVDRFGDPDDGPVALDPHASSTEDRIVRFVLMDRDNPSSIMSSITNARSNLRHARPVVPREVWELCNQLWSALKTWDEEPLSRDARARWLRLVVDECYRINGILLGTMRRDEAQSFLRIGQQLERAEMTCRVLAVRASSVVGATPSDSYQDAHHMAILRSLASYQPFRRTGTTSDKCALARFLIQDEHLPRSVMANLAELHGLLTTLPRHESVLPVCAEAESTVASARITDLDTDGLRSLLRDVQDAVSLIHHQVTTTYFSVFEPMEDELRASPARRPADRAIAGSARRPARSATIGPVEEGMALRVTHVTTYEYDAPVDYSYNEAHLRPREDNGQRCPSYRLEVIPESTGVREALDPFGNWVSVFAVRGGFEEMSVTATSEVITVSPPPAPPGLPWESVRKILDIDRQSTGEEARRYRASSRLIPTGPPFAAYAAESFTPRRPLIEAAVDLSGRIHRDFTYQPGFTSVSTPLREVFEQRRGVCQDFAHLMIACVRSIGLAARYVSGYILTHQLGEGSPSVGADASHAWASVYLPGWGWVDIDPTNDQFVGPSYVVTAWGRDYWDVSPLRGSVEGGGRSHQLRVAVDVRPLVEV